MNKRFSSDTIDFDICQAVGVKSVSVGEVGVLSRANIYILKQLRRNEKKMLTDMRAPRRNRDPPPDVALSRPSCRRVNPNFGIFAPRSVLRMDQSVDPVEKPQFVDDERGAKS